MTFQVYHKRRDAIECGVCKQVRAIPGQVVTIQTIEGATSHGGQLLPSAGCPDVVAGFGGRTYLVEIKTPGVVAAGQARIKVAEYAPGGEYNALASRVGRRKMAGLRRSQAEWMTAWAGAQCYVVETAQEFAAVLGLCLRCGILCDGGLCDHCAEL